jgi:inosose dehydratase
MLQSINRRECLQLGVATLLGTTLAAADKPAPRMSFGFSLYGMRTLPMDDALTACAKIGYDDVELAAMPGWPADPAKLDKDARKKLRDRLGELKLALPALMENLPASADDSVHKAQLERLKAVADLGCELSSSKPPIIETILGGKADQWETLRDLFVRRLTDWAKIGEAAKTIIAVKPHRFNAMDLPERGRWLIEQVKSPWIRLAYDWSHYEQRNLTMKETLQTVMPLACFVHVKDTVMVKDKPTFVLPGEGTTDYLKLLQGLKEEGYAGCVCVEVSAAVSGKKDYDPLAAAKKCYEKLAPAFEKAGVR